MSEKEVVIVEIISGSGWYKDAVGERFECVTWGREYVIEEDFGLGHRAMWRHIQRSDAVEAIEEQADE